MKNFPQRGNLLVQILVSVKLTSKIEQSLIFCPSLYLCRERWEETEAQGEQTYRFWDETLAVQPQGKVRSGSCPGNWDSEALDETPGKAAGRWCPELQENKGLGITNTPGRCSSCCIHPYVFMFYTSSCTQ